MKMSVYGYGALPADHGLFVALVSHGGVAHITLQIGGVGGPEDFAGQVRAQVSKLTLQLA